jgi:chromosome segregation ATPase
MVVESPIERVEQEIREVEQKIKGVEQEQEQEIRELEQKIKSVEGRLGPLEEKPLNDRSPKEETEITRLREEKKQLRKEKKQLRKEKLLLLRNDASFSGHLSSLSLETTKEYSFEQDAASSFVASKNKDIRSCCFSGVGVLHFAIPPNIQKKVVDFVPDVSEVEVAMA